MLDIQNEEIIIKESEEFTNSLSQLCEQLNTGGFGQSSPPVSSANTMFENNRWYLISNLRQLLSQTYVEHGIVQTLVDQPVDDAFRAGFEIKSAQLDGNDIEKLLIYCKRHNVIDSVKQASKWSRLYGGGAVIAITNQNPQVPLSLKQINENTPLEFRSVDMWELFYDVQNTTGGMQVGETIGAPVTDYFDYYGQSIHKSRVFRVVGKEAPSFIRPRLRGWGMSELERLVRSLNQYLKNQDLIFELLNEAKIDVYRIKGYNESLLSAQGTNNVAKRVQMANQIKNYNNALVMDMNDEYAQKQVTFAGLAEILLQIRQGIAADLKMPMTKLFGISSAGFNSGEDDIENYNSMVEGEVRSKIEWIMVDVLVVACQKVFGFAPDDLMIQWNPLRILNAKEEEEVKDSQFARTMATYTAGLATAQEAKEAINKDSLVGIELDETSDALPPLPNMDDEGLKVKPASGEADFAPPNKEKNWK
jgi:phage-related protein (TIGR01555 family)